MTRQEYIKKYTPIVLEVTKGTNLFPSVNMAQAILESSDSKGIPGNSTLARVYNNHFGIKDSKDWTGKTVNLKTGEVINGKYGIITDSFRVYENATDSFRDRVKFLIENKRYTNALKAKTPSEQSFLLEKAGYATAPNYNETIDYLIKSLNLLILDQKKK